MQLFTLIIVLAIVGGLGWEAYQFFLKPTVQNTSETETVSNADTSKTTDTALNKDSSSLNTMNQTTDTNIKFIMIMILFWFIIFLKQQIFY